MQVMSVGEEVRLRTGGVRCEPDNNTTIKIIHTLQSVQYLQGKIKKMQKLWNLWIVGRLCGFVKFLLWNQAPLVHWAGKFKICKLKESLYKQTRGRKIWILYE